MGVGSVSGLGNCEVEGEPKQVDAESQHLTIQVISLQCLAAGGVGWAGNIVVAKIWNVSIPFWCKKISGEIS